MTKFSPVASLGVVIAIAITGLMAGCETVKPAEHGSVIQTTIKADGSKTVTENRSDYANYANTKLEQRQPQQSEESETSRASEHRRTPGVSEQESYVSEAEQRQARTSAQLSMSLLSACASRR